MRDNLGGDVERVELVAMELGHISTIQFSRKSLASQNLGVDLIANSILLYRVRIHFMVSVQPLLSPRKRIFERFPDSTRLIVEHWILGSRFNATALDSKIWSDRR